MSSLDVDAWLAGTGTAPALERSSVPERFAALLRRGAGPTAASSDKRPDPATGERKRFASAILPALVRAGARFQNGQLVERPDESRGDQQAA